MLLPSPSPSQLGSFAVHIGFHCGIIWSPAHARCNAPFHLLYICWYFEAVLPRDADYLPSMNASYEIKQREATMCWRPEFCDCSAEWMWCGDFFCPRLCAIFCHNALQVNYSKSRTTSHSYKKEQKNSNCPKAKAWGLLHPMAAY